MANEEHFSDHYFQHLTLNNLPAFSHCGYMWLTPSSNKIVASPSVYQIFEIELSSPFPSHDMLQSFIHPDDRKRVLDAEKKIQTDHETLSIEYRIICKNGKEKSLHHHMQISTGYLNKELQIVSLVDDITEQKRADIILEVMNEGFYELDENFVLTRLNAKTEKMWNKGREELIGKCIWDVFPHAINTNFYNCLVQAHRDKASRVIEEISPLSHRWVHVSVSFYNNGLIVVFYDIDEQKKAQNKLKESETKWRTLVENTPDAISRWNADVKLTFANQVFEDIVGYRETGLVGQSIDDLGISKEGITEWKEIIQNVFHQKLPATYYFSINGIKGARHYYSKIVPEFDENGEVTEALSIATEISDLVKKEDQLRSMNESLQASNAELAELNHEITTLSNFASHELKEPLRRMYTAIEIIMNTEARKLSDAGRGHFRRLQSAVQKMGMITDELVSFMMAAEIRDKQTTSTVDLNEVLEEVKQQLKNYIVQKNGMIESGNLPCITGHRDMLLKLFHNLVHNALKFQEQNNNNPQVKIACNIVDKQDVPGTNLTYKKYFQLTFSDNGIGFVQGEAEKAFGLFSKLHDPDKFRGNGIGLAVCKKIMHQHEGLIAIESTPGDGTIVKCYFPIDEKPG